MTLIGRDLLMSVAQENREKARTLRLMRGSLAKAEECDRNADYFFDIAINLPCEENDPRIGMHSKGKAG